MLQTKPSPDKVVQGFAKFFAIEASIRKSEEEYFLCFILKVVRALTELLITTCSL